ncbi:ABC transporter substrate-binding protein [Saccharothrix coeruleofusca]|uniref:Sugar ABC transporter substrate-binding protein n=1 Tax=Saccharothrix coeruleofusca TaxID=33919 RepID=A0A918AUD2_9PSEU|nr:sugar ABC transporter substrate-binding protein [Saccharothrix coeruleofusca]MBP2335312.1 multiple sugar transport system substrate-binding protein [Saccharothrix coeruleofusca]GGP72103.1 sugar ABC transporter substrate-binding protein [Saccharothrix coeruleofusca]
MRLRALLTTAALLAASACGATPDAPAKTTLTWWDHYDSGAADQAVTALIARYQGAHPDVEVKRTAIPPAEFRAKLDQAAASGAFPDVVAVDSPDLPRLVAQNAVADLTDRFQGWAVGEALLEPVRESARHGGRFYGVPLRSETLALVYDREVLAGAAPPRTWDDLRATAKALTRDGRAGLCFAGLPEEDLTSTFLAFLWQAGGDLDTVDDEAGVEALAFVDELVNVDRSVPAAALGWDNAQVAREFAAGRCAMMVNGPRVVQVLNQAGMNWSVTALPSGAGGSASPLGGETWVIGKGSRHADAAWELLKSLAENRDNITEFGAGLGALPNRGDTVQDLAWQWDPNVAAFAAQMPEARPRNGYGTKYPQVSEAVWTMVQQVLKGDREPEEAAAEARAKIEPLLRER